VSRGSRRRAYRRWSWGTRTLVPAAVTLFVGDRVWFSSRVSIRICSASVGCLLFLFHLGFVARQLCFVDGFPCRIGRHFLFAFRNGFDHLLGREVFYQLTGVHLERAQWSQPCFHHGIVYFFRVQLLVDPLIYAHCHDMINIAGPRAKSKPVKGVYGPFPVLNLGGFRILLFTQC